mmetsp:Transcript_14495/g.36724  ORF Transcript_14495/g.36724 Transcript_14495/m.36724 type:complete len:370 (-) Transcript_14495:42-1151(-)
MRELEIERTFICLFRSRQYPRGWSCRPLGGRTTDALRANLAWYVDNPHGSHGLRLCGFLICTSLEEPGILDALLQVREVAPLLLVHVPLHQARRRVRGARQNCKLVRIELGAQAQLVVKDGADRAARALDRLDCRFRGGGDGDANRDVPLVRAVPQQLHARVVHRDGDCAAVLQVLEADLASGHDLYPVIADPPGQRIEVELGEHTLEALVAEAALGDPAVQRRLPTREARVGDLLPFPRASALVAAARRLTLPTAAPAPDADVGLVRARVRLEPVERERVVVDLRRTRAEHPQVQRGGLHARRVERQKHRRERGRSARGRYRRGQPWGGPPEAPERAPEDERHGRTRARASCEATKRFRPEGGASKLY